MICVVYKLYNILSVLNFLKMNRTPQCKKCERKFSTASNLEKHLKKKIPCNRVLKCEKCEKVFKYESEFKKHQDRKTPCEPIQGDPTKETPENTCHFCYKKFKSKYILKNHHNVCKIKNGGIALLFNEVKKLEQHVKELELENKNNEKNIQRIKELELENKNLKENCNNNYTGCVYFINIENTTKFKIGYTKHKPESRLSNLQTGCPEKLILFRYVMCNDPIKLEKYLHECFDDNKIRGEWYNMDHDDVEKLSEFLKNDS